MLCRVRESDFFRGGEAKSNHGEGRVVLDGPLLAAEAFRRAVRRKAVRRPRAEAGRLGDDVHSDACLFPVKAGENLEDGAGGAAAARPARRVQLEHLR